MADLIMYKEQLMQVEGLLEAQPDDESLKKLAADLKQLIELQMQLQGPKDDDRGAHNDIVPGNTCEAVSSVDGVYYAAEIVELLDGGKVVLVKFTAGPQANSSIKVKTASLRKVKSLVDGKKGAHSGDGSASKHAKLDQPLVVGAKRPATKQQEDEEFERKKAKNIKKKERRAEVEKERQEEKAKWNSFASKTMGKKKSIFATPDDPHGKVGVGTCNIGGKGMTEYSQRGKWAFNKDKEGEE